MKKIFILWRIKRKIKTVYFLLYERLFFNRDQLFEKEKKTFQKAGLPFEEGLKKLNNVLRRMDRGPFDWKSDSVHWLLFSCLSLTDNSFSRILEIGTGKGVGTRLLSLLFEDASVTTIDLPDGDPLSRSFYGRQEQAQFEEYLTIRKNNTASSSIVFKKTNSFFLLDHVQKPFDLVWIDGGHLYPEIAWDTSSAWYLCREEGFLMIDDVICTKRPYRSDLVSNDSHTVIRYVSERLNVTPYYFTKRINSESVSSSRRHKYVALLRKESLLS